MIQRIKYALMVLGLAGFALGCVPPQTHSVQQWHCTEQCYDWTEHDGAQTVKGGDERMYNFALSHDDSVVLLRGPYDNPQVVTG